MLQRFVGRRENVRRCSENIERNQNWLSFRSRKSRAILGRLSAFFIEVHSPASNTQFHLFISFSIYIAGGEPCQVFRHIRYCTYRRSNNGYSTEDFIARCWQIKTFYRSRTCLNPTPPHRAVSSALSTSILQHDPDKNCMQAWSIRHMCDISSISLVTLSLFHRYFSQCKKKHDFFLLFTTFKVLYGLTCCQLLAIEWKWQTNWVFCLKSTISSTNVANASIWLILTISF